MTGRKVSSEKRRAISTTLGFSPGPVEFGNNRNFLALHPSSPDGSLTLDGALSSLHA